MKKFFKNFFIKIFFIKKFFDSRNFSEASEKFLNFLKKFQRFSKSGRVWSIFKIWSIKFGRIWIVQNRSFFEKSSIFPKLAGLIDFHEKVHKKWSNGLHQICHKVAHFWPNFITFRPIWLQKMFPVPFFFSSLGAIARFNHFENRT